MMKRTACMLLIGVFAMSLFAGCGQQVTPEFASAAARIAGYAAGKGLVCANDKLTQEQKELAFGAVTELSVSARDLSESGKIEDALYPLAEKEVRRYAQYMSGITESQIADVLFLTKTLLQTADATLARYPQFAEQRDQWSPVLLGFLDGAYYGIGTCANQNKERTAKELVE